MEIAISMFLIAVGFYCVGRAHQVMLDSNEKIKALKAIQKTSAPQRAKEGDA